MDLLRRLLGRTAEEEAPPVPDERQQVTVLLRLSDPELGNEREQMAVYSLEDRLMKALDESGVGTHETNELERGFLRIQLMGPDADRIVEVIRPHLKSVPAGSYLAVRRGPEGTGEERVDVDGDQK